MNEHYMGLILLVVMSTALLAMAVIYKAELNTLEEQWENIQIILEQRPTGE